MQVVHLHPHRAPGVLYLVLAVAVGVVVVLGLVSYLSSGRFGSAAVTLVVGLGVTAFVGGLALAILVPGLDLDGERVRGRVAVRTTVDVGWDEVVVDVDDDSPRGRFRLDLGATSLTVDARSWTGFGEVVLLLASTPAPGRRLTPAARREVARLLQLDD